MNKPFVKEKSKKIFASVFRSYTAVVVLVLMLACFFSFNLVRNYVINWHQEELLSQAETIAVNASQSPDWAILKRYQKLLDAKIIFVSKGYTAVFADDFDVKEVSEDVELVTRQVESKRDLHLISSALLGEKTTGIREIDFLSLSAIYANIPLHTADGTLYGALLIVRPEDSVNGVWMHIFRNMLVAALLAMAFVTVITTLLARRFTKPLSHMEKAALKIAEGDYSARVKIFKNDEIGKLGMTLNLLSEKLEDVIERLRMKSASLKWCFTISGKALFPAISMAKFFMSTIPRLHFLKSAIGTIKARPMKTKKRNAFLRFFRGVWKTACRKRIHSKMRPSAILRFSHRPY